MPKRYYTLYCDESAEKGRHYSNFYGGALLASREREAIEAALREKKEELNLHKEIKWTKITENYETKYIEFIRYFFSFVESGRIKIRIMFTHNFNRPVGLTDNQLKNSYFILYYQLIKHAFGFVFSNPNGLDKIYISVMLDELPVRSEKKDEFKTYISAISQTRPYIGKDVYFPKDDIADVDSKLHCIMQGLDIIIGAMQFRLNDMHKEKPAGARRRGKRTIAKERVYKEINRLIRSNYPNFNIGITTGAPNGDSDRWNQPYRHWRFVSRDSERNPQAAKRKAPPKPTSELLVELEASIPAGPEE
jgi:hypothetical protein